MKNVQATVYNLENDKIAVSKMSEDAIFEEKNENIRIFKLVLPNVKVGSVITLSYLKSSPFINKYQPWYFQSDIPVLYSEYNASIPGNYEYHIKLVGALPLDVNKSDVEYNCLEAGRGVSVNCALYRYVMLDIPAYKKEKFTTTAENYLSRIEYELSVVRQFNGEVEKLTKSWDDVDKELRSDSDFGRQVSKKKLVKEVLPAQITGLTDEVEKAKQIYQFVLDNYKWNGESGRYDASIKRLIENKGGNAFEVNLFLQNLLHAEGLESYPVLISTRENGLATKVYPVFSDFNYVIVNLVIGDITYFLDATNPYLSFGELPYRCLNQYGRVYTEEYGTYWEDIALKSYSSIQVSGKFSLSETDNLEGDLSMNYSGFLSHSKKQSYNENKSTYLEGLKGNFYNSSINAHKVTSENKNDIKFSEQINLTYEDEFVANKIYLNPFLIKFFDENPFKLNQRTYPVDFGFKLAYNYVLEINLGDRLKVIELPKNSSFALPNRKGVAQLMCASKDNKVTIFMKIQLNEPIYTIDYYASLKEYMSKIVDFQNNTVVVLEKI